MKAEEQPEWIEGTGLGQTHPVSQCQPGQDGGRRQGVDLGKPQELGTGWHHEQNEPGGLVPSTAWALFIHFETASCQGAQADVKLLTSPPECWDYRSTYHT